MTDRCFVDTSVWVYAIDRDEAEKQARAKTVLAPESGNDLVVSAQVLGEFFVTVTRKLSRAISTDQAMELVDRMSRLPVIPVDARLVATAVSGSRAWGISYWDALIIAAAEVGGCARVLSEDLAHGTAYGSVRVENPFLDSRVGVPS
jgi:predicted nucleic acid-binding protein